MEQKKVWKVELSAYFGPKIEYMGLLERETAHTIWFGGTMQRKIKNPYPGYETQYFTDYNEALLFALNWTDEQIQEAYNRVEKTRAWRDKLEALYESDFEKVD